MPKETAWVDALYWMFWKTRFAEGDPVDVWLGGHALNLVRDCLGHDKFKTWLKDNDILEEAQNHGWNSRGKHRSES